MSKNQILLGKQYTLDMGQNVTVIPRKVLSYGIECDYVNSTPGRKEIIQFEIWKMNGFDVSFGVVEEHNPVKALKKAFEDVVNNPELQENYDRFQRDLENAKEKHNELVLKLNQRLDIIQTLKGSILNLALEGVLSPEASEEVKELETENDDLIKKIKHYKDNINYNKNLIKKYKDWSDRKLFIWWQSIKAVDPETLPWLEWKETYNDKIF